MEYLRFEIKDFPTEKLGFFKSGIQVILKMVLPVANPSYENKIDLVKTWFVEFENKSSIPVREIGLDVAGVPIVKMPFNNNIGYWCDNNLKYQDFLAEFEVQLMVPSEFEKLWNDL